MAKRKQPKQTQYQIKTEPPYRFLTAVPRFEWRTPWSTPPTQMGPKSRQWGSARIAGTGVTEAPTEFLRDVPSFEWRQPLSTPQKRMGPISRMVGAALIAATGLFAPVFTPPATAPDMDWLSPLSTPTPDKLGLPTHQQQTIAFTPENFPSCGLVGVDTEGTVLVSGGVAVNTIDYTGITVGGGQNRALVAMITTDSTAGLTAVWDQGGTDQAMTLVGSSSSFAQTIGIFGLLNPISGNNTLRFSWTTPGTPVVSAISLITVDQSSDSNAFQNYQFNTGNVSSLSVTVPSKPGDIVVGIGGVAGPTVTAVGDNSIYVDNTSVGSHSGAGWNVGTPSVTFTGTSSTSGNWLLTAINVSAYPCPIDVDFISPFAEPPRREAGLHPSLHDTTTDVYQVTPEVVTVDEWFSALSEPPRIERLNTSLYRVLATEYFPDAFGQWFNPLSEPTRTKRGLNAALQRTLATEYFPDAPNAIAGQWYGSFSEPVRIEPRLSALYQAYTTEYYPDTFTQWFTPLSEPARIERSLTAPDQSVVPYVATEVVTVDKWFDAFSEPARIERFNAALYRAFTSEYYPETFTQWLIPLSEPTRTKRSLNALDQSWVPFVTTETVTVDKWFGALSEPARTTRRITTPDQGYVPVVTTEVVTVDKWFDPLSEPVRTKSALRAALQPATTYDTKLFPDPANFLEGWSSRLAEPVRQKLGLNTAIQSAYTSGYFSFEIVTVDKWFDALSEPKRSKPALQASLQTIGSPSFEVVTVDKWYAPLSDPKRFKPALHVSLQQTLTQDTVFIPSPSQYMEGWYGAFSEPQRQQAGLKAAQQVPYFNSYVNVAGEIITVDKWFKSFADPIRPERPADDRYAGENNWEAVAASMEWFAPFTEPVRFKPGLVPATRPPFFAAPAVIITPSLASWWRPLAEPPKAKVRLGTHLQRAFTQDPKLFPNPSRFLEGWYNWWSEPVRHLAQLNAALQRSWTAPDRRPVLATITVTMAATEINDDVALFAIKVFAGNPPATAVVSLVEIGHGASLTSIVEEGDDGSGTSIVES